VRSGYSHKRETVTKLFTSIKAAIIDWRSELPVRRIESRFGADRRVMIDLPDIALRMIAQEVDEFCRKVVTTRASEALGTICPKLWKVSRLEWDRFGDSLE
jgi:hypothetical protein